MNNKKLGTFWERECAEILSKKGFWVHFITPNVAGQQPFDLIAVKDDRPYAIDCKTTISPIFPLSRLEENQLTAFDLWLRCGNRHCLIAIKYDGKFYQVPYEWLAETGKVDLRKMEGEIIDDEND